MVHATCVLVLVLLIDTSYSLLEVVVVVDPFHSFTHDCSWWNLDISMAGRKHV